MNTEPTLPMNITKHIYISGHVQGVGFRYYTRKNAMELGITGWVKNLPDGRVEAVLQGPKEHVCSLITRIKKGPIYSSVSRVEVSEIQAGTFTTFDVLR